MATNGNEKERVIVVLSLSGGNDGLNTLIPYSNPTYYDYRNTLGISEDQVIRINDEVGFHPSMTELKEIYDQGNMAVIQGVGYPNPSRSHFRSMDIWHTCEPDTIGSEGWLGRTIRDLDPNHENVLTGVNFGRGLPRALAAPGVPVASVGNLATYGLLTGIPGEEERSQALDIFSRMYSPAIGSGPIMDYIWETGRAALKGADILKVAPEMYSSSVEYGNYPIAQGMRGIAQVHFANLGTRILYTTSPYNSFDTHANQAGDHARLWRQVSETVSDFYEDLREHHRGDEVLLFMFSEFGRESAGQRRRNGPRHRRRLLGHRRPREGRAVRRVPVPQRGRPGGRRGPAAYRGLPQRLRHHAGTVVGDGLEANRRRHIRATRFSQLTSETNVLNLH